jgi:hypothetical protein
MNTLLYLGQIVIGTVVVVAGLVGPAERRGASTSLRNYADIQIGGLNGLIGVLFGTAALVLGVVGLGGTTVVSVPVAFLVTAAGLVSVVLGIEISSPVHPVQTEEFAVARESRPDAGAGAVVALPDRDRAGAEVGSGARAA